MSFGVKSATAAQRMAALLSEKLFTAAENISSALSTFTTFTFALFICKETGPLTNITSAPLSAHSSAKAYPILPEE